jgi:hypothetical protein
VIERDEGSPDARFPSNPGDVYPMWHVFASVAERRDARVTDARSSQPLRAVALALDSDDGVRVVVANVTPRADRVLVRGLPPGDGRLLVLDATTVERAMRDPLGFRVDGRPVTVEEPGITLELGPYAVATIDAAR